VSDLHLVIGNKNYSSWSMRPWLAMKAAGLEFRDTVIPLDTPEFKAEVLKHSRAGRVPVLHHGNLTIWESLAIIEYVAETFPDAGIWPADRAARAMARAVSSEMHAGFSALRNACPMNLRRPPKPVPMNEAVKNDVAAIEALWAQCRKSFGRNGLFLFGDFSAADAMYAPVVTRFMTYEIPVTAETRDYMAAVTSHPAFVAWRNDALKETWIVPSDEVD
jgi:glutathione S-transferase